MDFENMENNSVEDLVLEALCCDGASHKQWFLEQILLKLIGRDSIEDLHIEHGFEWEEGVSP